MVRNQILIKLKKKNIFRNSKVFYHNRYCINTIKRKNTDVVRHVNERRRRGDLTAFIEYTSSTVGR